MMVHPESSVLLTILVRPERLLQLSVPELTLVLRQARRAGLLGWLACCIDRLGLYAKCPQQLQNHLTAARIFAAEHERMVRWEVHHILRALRGLDPTLVLLKGAAYCMSGMELACGRLLSDVDILVPKSELDRVESALRAQGWEPMKLDDYDQSYYRRWMHELPPLRHRQRGTIVDVHHRILPATSRLKPDSKLLLSASVALPDKRLRTLCPTDAVLHKVVHLFQDGDLHNALRELVDLDGLLKAYAEDESFWDALIPRARQLGLMRPLYYGLRYTHRLLSTPVPGRVREAVKTGQPVFLVRMLMDILITSVLVPGDPDRTYPGKAVAGWLLYVRSHWLRMPPLLLARHLLVKAFKRNKSTLQPQDTG